MDVKLQGSLVCVRLTCFEFQELDIVWTDKVDFIFFSAEFNENLIYFHSRRVWFSRPASTLASFTSSTTSTTVTTCPVCPSVPWSRAPTRWTASSHGPLRRRSSPSSWWSLLPSASWCASVRWSTSSASASVNSLGGRTRRRGNCLLRITRWHLWQHRGQSSSPNHLSGWIQQPLSKTSAPSLRSNHLRNKRSQYSGETEQTMRDVWFHQTVEDCHTD